MSLELLAGISNDLCDREATGFCCPFTDCRRDFTSKRNLVDHCRGHHQGKKPHSCAFPGCGKSFLRPAHLLIHTRIHTGEKPFVCEYKGCGKRWNQKSALKQHMRSHTGEKPFGCSLEGCTKRFSTSSSCKRHVLTHGKLVTSDMSILGSRKRSWSFDDSSSSSSSSSPSSPSLSSSDAEDEQPMFKRVAMDRLASDLSFQMTKMAMTFILN